MRRRGLAVALVCLVLASVAHAGRLPLPTRLANALAVRGVATETSAAVAVGLLTGRTLFARHAELSLVPASNEKLPVTYAALVELGPAYRFRTEVLGRGRQDEDVWRGNLILKGYGDPTLDSTAIARLATQLKRLGIRHVTGRVLGDESWFDLQRTAPGWKPSFFLSESAPISALVVDRDVHEGHLALQPALAAAARLRQLLRRHGVTTGAVGVGHA